MATEQKSQGHQFCFGQIGNFARGGKLTKMQLRISMFLIIFDEQVEIRCDYPFPE